MWDGQNWSAVGGGFAGTARVFALAVDGQGNLYASGILRELGSVAKPVRCTQGWVARKQIEARLCSSCVIPQRLQLGNQTIFQPSSQIQGNTPIHHLIFSRGKSKNLHFLPLS